MNNFNIVKKMISHNILRTRLPLYKYFKQCLNYVCCRGYVETNNTLFGSFELVKPLPMTLVCEKSYKYFQNSDKYKQYVIQDKTKKHQVNFVDQQTKLMLNGDCTFFQSCSDNELLQLLCILSVHLRNSTQFNKQTSYIIQCFDNECCHRFNNMTVDIILKALNLWVSILSNGISRLTFYSLFINKMNNWKSCEKLTLKEVTQIMFYVSLCKPFSEKKSAIINCLHRLHHIININELSHEEICVISNSAFKTSSKITSNKVLTAFTHILSTRLNEIISDISFITFLKVLRHAQFYDYGLLDSIAKALISDDFVKTLDFTEKIHIFSYYADALLDEKQLFECLLSSCFEDLKKSVGHNIDSVIRLKDLSRFLWAASYLGLAFPKYHVEEVLVPLLIKKFKTMEHMKSPQHLVGSVLSLWMMGVFSEPLFQFITLEYIRMLKSSGKDRLKARLMLLCTCVSVESPSFLKNFHMALLPERTALQDTVPDVQLQGRTKLKQIYDAAICLQKQLNLSSVQCGFSIPHLHILGIEIEFSSKKRVYIEVLDRTVCLHNSEVPHGLMKLKLRLLNSKGCIVLVFSNKQLEEFEDPSDYFVFLEDELKKATQQSQQIGEQG